MSEGDIARLLNMYNCESWRRTVDDKSGKQLLQEIHKAYEEFLEIAMEIIQTTMKSFSNFLKRVIE